MTASTAAPDDSRLMALRREFEHEARFSLVFVVLTVGASLIASLGLLANSAGVVIGAMVVAPWILPLQAMAFEILRGRLPMFLRALRTLLGGVVICVLLAMGVGHLVAFPSFGSEVMNRTSPNLLDLGVALVAGAVAMFAKLRKDAISALAGLAIAVALVPPMCVVGILLASSHWVQAYGALLLFTTNLLGIMVGAMAALATLERVYRGRLLRSRLGLTSVALTALLVIPLGTSFFRLLDRSRLETKAEQLETAIEHQLRSSTITLGGDPDIDMIGISHRLAAESTADPGPGAGHRSQVAHVQPGGGGAGLHQQEPGAPALSVGGAAHRGGPDRPGNRPQSPRARGAASPGAAAVAGRGPPGGVGAGGAVKGPWFRRPPQR